MSELGNAARIEPVSYDGQLNFEFTDADFRRLRSMISQYAGISLNDSKRTMAYGRLAKLLRQRGIRSFADYLNSVEADHGEERAAFVNALTTNLTAFFREPHHFPILTEHLREHYTDEPLTVWSSACSTGEEPYSIAMSVIDAFGTDTPPVRIIASDLDTEALNTAAKGVYPMEKLSGLSAGQLKRFFLKGTGAQSGLARIRPQVRKLVEFKQLNLHQGDWNLPSPLAAIFCRNVMIYFSKDTQAEILRRFAPLLKPSGLLFAGHSENFFYNAGDVFRLRGKTVYELQSAAGAPGPRLRKL